ncbi:family 43 glycosylhydrolase [Granulicella cerasi]|uniref:Family 43 glycosylhydrolase n=1 Tax=Granulicella cerasi TaxID=741063 RepID=A0ABW1ZEQ9_9BACT|nr:family 43 glycosylhydrolase [Granulicella cerasi]
MKISSCLSTAFQASLVFVAALCVKPAYAQAPRVQVLGPHLVALRFSPEYPYARHSQNPLPGEGLVLPAPESSFIKGQAGQGSENKANSAEYRIPVPDFAGDAGITGVSLLADLELTKGASLPSINDAQSTERPTADSAVISRFARSSSTLGHMREFDAGVFGEKMNPAEITIAFSVNAGGRVWLHGSHGPLGQDPILLLRTRAKLGKPVGWRSAEQSGLLLPKISPLFDQFLRDTSIVLAPDGMYYMTGTTGGPEAMVVTSDLSVWKSPDLSHWSPVRDVPRQSTVVWNIDRDGTWMKPITLRDGEPFRPLWAPEIHYINGTFWIPFSVPRHGVTLLRSKTGKAEGPYEIAIKPDKPVSDGIDASLFQDDDGEVYFLYGGGWIAKMKPDMSGIAEPFRHISSASGRDVGFEGVSLFKRDGVYILCAADFVQGDYSTYISTSKSLSGPWSERYLAVPHAGHANFFEDKQHRIWSTYFGNDRHAPFSARPGILPLVQDARGRWHPDLSYKGPEPDRPDKQGITVQVVGAIGPSDGKPQQVGVMPVNDSARRLPLEGLSK